MNDQLANEPPVPLLAARGLGRRAGADGVWLLRDVSFALSAGDRVGLVGPSGAGKTVLLRALARLDPLTSGEILWQGEVVDGHRVPAFRAQVMYLHQRPVFVEGSVETNLRLPFSLSQHRGRSYCEEQVVAWLDLLRRDASFLAKDVHDLSGGEGQLAGLLRAVQLDPQVLLLDEPTAALDRPTATQIEQFVAQWLAERRGERAYIWVSHDSQQAQRTCETIMMMNGGEVMAGT